jgi:hypothetical protein
MNNDNDKTFCMTLAAAVKSLHLSNKEKLRRKSYHDVIKQSYVKGIS